jgi:acetylaranotin biosynthesis cluster protein L
VSELLEFEHIIEVNDLSNPDMLALSREVLWQGLVYRASYPDHFNPALSCRLEPGTENRFVRCIDVGELQLRDEVTLVPMQEIHTLIDGRTQAMHAESVTSIDEPEPGRLFVRFRYRRDAIAVEGGLNANDYLKEAYRQQDLEAIKTIREMAANKQLSGNSGH